MGWYIEILFLLLIKHTISTGEVFHNSNLPTNINEEDIYPNVADTEDENIPFANEIVDTKLQQIGKILATILIQPWPKGISPIIYVENIPPEYQHGDSFIADRIAETDNTNIPFKRSRYYRKYPWKRQNSRYDAENRYLCQPTKEDVFRLLVALHEARQGNRGQTINFCNRRRPASAVFTNIRFLG